MNEAIHHLGNDSSSFHPAHSLIRGVGPPDLHHAKGRGLENCCSEDLLWGSERDILASRAYQAMVNMSKKHIAHTKEYSLLYD